MIALKPTAPLLEKALRGGVLSVQEGYQLIQCRGEEAEALFQAAGKLRDRLKGRVVTYSRKVFLPVTNLCRDRCAYCTFRKDPDDPAAWTMSPEEIETAVQKANGFGCKEALMCLGDKPELAFAQYRLTLADFGHRTTAEYVHHACVIAIENGLLPHTNAGLLSYEEMRMLKPVNASLGLMLENVSPRLLDKGMAHFSAPDKDPVLRLKMIREAGELSIPFTTGILVGIGETFEERVDSLSAIRDLHTTYGHIQEVIIQNFRSKPETRMAEADEPDEIDVAVTVATARLMLGAMNIQAPPNLSPSDHRLLLHAGINDWGGISPVTRDYINPEAAWPEIEALEQTCRDEGFELRERLAVYEEYVDRREFLDPAIRPLAMNLQNRIAS